MLVRTSSRVGISVAGASKGVSRVVTIWLTTIHGTTMWLPGPSVRSNRPRRSRTAREPSGTGTMKARKMPSRMSRPPTASRTAAQRQGHVGDETAQEGDHAGEHEPVADPVRLTGQDDDREAAGLVLRGKRLGRFVERDADLGELHGHGRATMACACGSICAVSVAIGQPLPAGAAASATAVDALGRATCR